MRAIKVIFYTILGWAIGVPTSFAMICAYEKAAGVEHPFLCDPPAWFMLFSLLILLPLCMYGNFIVGRWAWSKSKLWSGVFATAGIATIVLMR